MKRIGISLLSCAAAWNVSSQTVAPNAISLTAYAASLQAPARVATDAAGYVYVTEPQAGRVVVFDTFGRQSSAHTGLGRPLGIAVDGQGHIFLADEQTGSVSVFDAQWTRLYKLGAGDGE
jgi:sugar lactone lactonase YvrE